jgi:hypothetical protein
MKINIIVYVLLLVFLFSGCNNGADQPRGNNQTDSTADNGAISGIVVLNGGNDKEGESAKAGLLDKRILNGTDFRSQISNPKEGAGLSPIQPYSLVIDSTGLRLNNGAKLFSDNLDLLVGSIIAIDSVTDTASNSKRVNFRLLNNIVRDTVKLKVNIYTPKLADSKQTTINKSTAANFGFLGISASMSNTQLYTYSQTDVAGLIASDKQLDTMKISKKYKCNSPAGCNYFVIIGASVTQIQTRLYTVRTKNLKVADFPGVSQAFGASGGLAVANSNDQQQINYFLYLQLRDISSFLNP